MEELPLSAVLGAILCGIIANKQNRSVGWGIIFGELFGIFAIIAYLIIGDKENSHDNRRKSKSLR